VKISIAYKPQNKTLRNPDLKESEMAKKFSDLRAGMTQASCKRSAAKAKVMLSEMPLDELRQSCGLSQKMLADVLHVKQPSIAKIEKRIHT
jgi:DNA-binding XRE family transcriptional regulator